MAETVLFAAGGYRYVPAVFQYSAAVTAQAGFELERARFMRPVALADAFAAVEAHLKRLGRPPAAFAQCELRAPAPFTDQGFIEFNRHYVSTLERWGIFKDGVNPVARTNVCPVYDVPAEVSMHAFTYAVPAPAAPRRSFVLSGGGDARGGAAPYNERIVRFGDTSAEGLREKVAYVIDLMEQRLQALGAGWPEVVSTQAYTVQNIGHLVGEELARRGAIAGGLVWHYARPPVIGLEYEMDAWAVGREVVL
jgi:hypothetical protein